MAAVGYVRDEDTYDLVRREHDVVSALDDPHALDDLDPEATGHATCWWGAWGRGAYCRSPTRMRSCPSCVSSRPLTRMSTGRDERMNDQVEEELRAI